MAERRILLVRHPETTANVDGTFVGRGNAPFTDRGQRQVGLLAQRITAFAPELLLSSPLARTRVVADAAAGLLGIEALYDERLTELDFGQAEGLTWDETQARGIRFDFRSWDAPVASGGESRREIYERTAAVLDQVLHGAGHRTAIVTHGGVFRSALPYLLGLDHDAIWSFDIRNGQIAELRFLKDHAQLTGFITVG